MDVPEIIYHQEPSGQCPVQAEGTVNGRLFYFRARGQYWSLSVAGLSGDVFEPDTWFHEERYDGSAGRGLFKAGYATPDECRIFIDRVANLWLIQERKALLELKLELDRRQEELGT